MRPMNELGSSWIKRQRLNNVDKQTRIEGSEEKLPKIAYHSVKMYVKCTLWQNELAYDLHITFLYEIMNCIPS